MFLWLIGFALEVIFGHNAAAACICLGVYVCSYGETLILGGGAHRGNHSDSLGAMVQSLYSESVDQQFSFENMSTKLNYAKVRCVLALGLMAIY
jgi:hypothetical protein